MLKVNYTRLEIFGALVAALIAAGSIFWWMVGLYDERQPLGVVAAATDLTAPRVLKSSDLVVLNISRRSVPKTALVDIKQVAGQMLTRSVSANEVLTTQDVVYDRDPDSAAALVPFGLVGFNLPISWLSAGFPKIKKNDFITIYLAFPPVRYTPAGSGAVARGVPVLSVSADKDGFPTSVLIAAAGDTVGRLLQAHASNFPLVVVVESAQPVSLSTSTAR